MKECNMFTYLKNLFKSQEELLEILNKEFDQTIFNLFIKKYKKDKSYKNLFQSYLKLKENNLYESAGHLKASFSFTYDFDNSVLKNASCLDFWEKKVDKLYTITTNNSEIKCSRNHIIFVEKDDKVMEVPAKSLKAGDSLFYVNEKMEVEKDSIVNISIEEGEFELIDISVKNQTLSQTMP